MASTASFKVVFCFAVCYLATLSSGVGMIEDLKAADENLNLRDAIVVRAAVPLDLKYLPRENTVIITVTETVCEFSSTIPSKPSTTISIPATSTVATTTSMSTPQSTVSTSASFTTSSVEQTTSHRTSSTSSSSVSTPVPSSSGPPFAPPLSDSASGQGKIRFALLAWSLVMTSFMNV